MKKASSAISVLRVVGRGWLMQLKILSRSWFNAVLGVLWPLFFASSAFLMYGTHSGSHLSSVVVGASMMGIWSSTSTSGAGAMQRERRQGTLELLAAAPAPFAATLMPLTLAMSTIGIYSMAATLIWGHFVFGIALTVADPAQFTVSVLVTVISVGMFGFLLSVSVVRYRSAWALGNMLEFPVWLICGFLVSSSLLPGWVRPISWLLPPTWGVQAVQEAALGRPVLAPLLLAIGLAGMYCLAGLLLARRMLAAARASATLALS